MRPEEFLDFAHSISTDSEAARRSAVSRAYYAAHHKGRWFIETMCAIPLHSPSRRKGEIHYLVYDCLGALQYNDLPVVGQMLKDLYGRRVTADYHLNQPDFQGQEVTDDCLDSADYIVQILQKGLEPEATEEVKRNIENYLKTRFGLT